MGHGLKNKQMNRLTVKWTEGGMDAQTKDEQTDKWMEGHSHRQMDEQTTRFV